MRAESSSNTTYLKSFSLNSKKNNVVVYLPSGLFFHINSISHCRCKFIFSSSKSFILFSAFFRYKHFIKKIFFFFIHKYFFFLTKQLFLMILLTTIFLSFKKKKKNHTRTRFLTSNAGAEFFFSLTGLVILSSMTFSNR